MTTMDFDTANFGLYASFEDDEYHNAECPECGMRFDVTNTWPICINHECGWVDKRGLTSGRIQFAARLLDEQLHAAAVAAYAHAPYALPAFALNDAWSVIRAAIAEGLVDAALKEVMA
jgi:hypothetical protein